LSQNAGGSPHRGAVYVERARDRGPEREFAAGQSTHRPHEPPDRCWRHQRGGRCRRRTVPSGRCRWEKSLRAAAGC